MYWHAHYKQTTGFRNWVSMKVMPIFCQAAEPRRIGQQNFPPFYQPVDGKAFISICGKIYEATDLPVKVFPVLPAKDYPLSEQNRERYAKGLEQVTKFFRENKIFQEPV